MLQIPHRPTLFSFVQFHSNVSLNISAYMSKQSVVNKKKTCFRYWKNVPMHWLIFCIKMINIKKLSYLSRGVKIPPKWVPGASPQLVLMTHSMPQVVRFTGVGDRVTIGNLPLEGFEPQRNRKEQAKAETRPIENIYL